MMRTRTYFVVLMILAILIGASACSSATTVAVAPARSTLMPWSYQPTATPVGPMLMPPAYGSDSGLSITARLNVPCARSLSSSGLCNQAYIGQFVVTTDNGAVMAYVATNDAGQALVSLPPGQYWVGALTTGYYPQTAPVAVNVYSGSYAPVWLVLNAGPQQTVSRW